MKLSRFTEEKIIGILREQKSVRRRPMYAASTESIARPFTRKGQANSSCCGTRPGAPPFARVRSELDFGQNLNGLAIDQGAKYGVHQFLYGHGQAETARKIAVASTYPANALSPALSKLAKVELRTCSTTRPFSSFMNISFFVFAPYMLPILGIYMLLYLV